MKYEEFCQHVRNGMYETIYDDSEGREILVIELLDAYDMFNKAQRQAIEQAQKQEPVAWLNRDSVDGLWYPNAFKTDNLEPSIPLYTSPPQRQWVGLTQEEFDKLIDDAGFTRSDLLMIGACVEQIVDLVEKKLKEKNHA